MTQVLERPRTAKAPTMNTKTRKPLVDIEKAAAAALFEECRQAFAHTERIIIRLIQTRAWETLGYGSFAEAWRERMKGVRLAEHVRAHLVYAMLDESTADEIARSVTGISTRTIKNLAREKANGVLPDGARGKDERTPLARTRVEAHMRKLPSAPQTVRVTVPAEEYKQWSEWAEEAGSSLALEAEAALRHHFEVMGRRHASK